MTATRRGLLGAALTVPVAGVGETPTLHPDAALLDLCAQLRRQEDEWQRRYAGEGSRDDYVHFNDWVWPGIGLGCGWWRDDHGGYVDHDVPAKLMGLRARTPEGLAAKAAAVLAMQEAGCWGADVRDDSWQMVMNVLEDAAGALQRPMGGDVPGAPS